MNGIIKQNAFWIALSAIGVFWLSVWILGSDLTRDTVDWASIIMGLILSARLLPDALDRFVRGASKAGWQLLLGNVLFLLGWVAFCTWTYILRSEEWPEWMVTSPLNGFFKFWILSGIVLSYFATSSELTFRNPGKVYYIGVAFIAGGLCALAVYRGLGF